MEKKFSNSFYVSGFETLLFFSVRAFFSAPRVAIHPPSSKRCPTSLQLHGSCQQNLFLGKWSSDVCACDCWEAGGTQFLILTKCLSQCRSMSVISAISPVSASVQLKNWMNWHTAGKHNPVHEALPVKSQWELLRVAKMMIKNNNESML